MAKLDRQTQLIFASSAGNRSLTAFGTAKTDTPEYTTNVESIQNSNYLAGWDSAILADKAPYEEDTNGLLYMITRQLAYLYQSGIPEYDVNTTYFKGNTVAAADGSGVWYKSLSDDNVGNPLTDTTNWGVVELSKRTLPLFSQVTLDYVLQNDDAIGWALQGSLVNGAVYSEAFNRLLTLYNTGTVTNYRGINATLTGDGRYLTALSNKNAVDNLFNNTGVADFYVLDTSTQSFYLPKTSKFIQYTIETSSVNKYTAAGLPTPSVTLSGMDAVSTSVAGNHAHTRGSMDITGTIRAGVNGGKDATGAFSFVKNISAGFEAGPHNTLGIDDFKASRSWTGYTSTNGEHTHRVDLSNITATVTGDLYGASNTVQVTASNKLLYYLVGDTAN